VGQAPVDAVDSLNGLINDITLVSNNGSITFTNEGQSINAEVVPVPVVTTFNGASGAIGMFSESGTITFTPTTGSEVISIDAVPPERVTTLNNLSNAVSIVSPNNTVSIQQINQDIELDTRVYSATYYKTAPQNLTSGNTDITFDATGTWNITGDFITHTNGTSAFTVVQTGLYQLEFNAVILLNNGTWTTTTNKTCNIDITRSPSAEIAVIINSSLMAPQNYGQSVSATTYLVAGDVINLRIGNTFTTPGITPPQAQGVGTAPFDLNTFFTWTYVSRGAI
jgi:hypothetical protein